MRGQRGDPTGEAGSVALGYGAFLIWLAIIASIVVIDISAYLVAAARAQQAADAAALAAVSADATLRVGRDDPAREARTVAGRAGARLERCACRRGLGRAHVRVSVEVGGLVVPRVQSFQRVAAVAQAHLAPPDPDDARTTVLPPAPSPGPAPPRTPGAPG